MIAINSVNLAYQMCYSLLKLSISKINVYIYQLKSSRRLKMIGLASYTAYALRTITATQVTKKSEGELCPEEQSWPQINLRTKCKTYRPTTESPNCIAYLRG